jgi:aspartate/methionine/tyrosine aminotransferase
MRQTPINAEAVEKAVNALHLPDFSHATIREIVTVSHAIEAATGEHFVHMEMGVPGLPPESIGVEAEIEALHKGVASKYPPLQGIEALKNETARFVKAFINVDVNPACCVPTSGSMQGTFASFLVCGQCNPTKDTVLFIDPGFPVQKDQLTVIGMKHETFDMFEYRGEKLLTKLESMLKKGNICAIVYSNPNNPSWTCLTDAELQGIGRLATQYDAVVMEDLAYFGMDFRTDLSKPFTPPYQPSVAHYTDNYILLISGSKAFSYAGQRIGVSVISEKLYNRTYPALKERYTIGEFGNIFVNRVLYTLSSGTAHSAQCALAAMFKAACDGKYNFLEAVHEYGRRAGILKRIFCENGFHIVYEKDLGRNIGDGFYFTVGYGDMTGGELMRELLFYGVSAIALNTTGSLQQGVRVCTSFIDDDQYDVFEQRMKAFQKDHPQNK